MEAAMRLGIREWLAALGCAVAALLLISPPAHAGVVTDGVPGSPGCPPIADKPDATPHVDYDGVKHITYCYGPITITPGQNIIKLRPAIDGAGNKLWPQQDGYITRFDPEFIYADGTVPRVDVLHLHHAVWLVNNAPQFAVGEEKTVQQLPQGFGWRNLHKDGPSDPDSSDTWVLNDMLHDLVAQPAQVYVVWRIDFVPDTAPGAADIKPVRTQWMDVAGQSLYPVFDSLRSYGHNGTYTFPDQAPASDLQPCSLLGGKGDRHGCLGGAQSWTVKNHPQTLIATAGHLHPGGLYTQLRDTRPGVGTNTLFTSNAHYYEPAGEVSWDVAMGGTPSNWQVEVKPGDKVSVHATYDTRRADWYEVMGIMAIAVYDGTLPGSQNAQDPACPDGSSPPGCIPEKGVLTHSHLSENDNHGGDPTGAPDPLALPSVAVPDGTVGIRSFAYQGVPGAGPSVPTIEPGQSLTFKSYDAVPSVNAFHTITACKDPCTATTGIAYPIANGSVTFDSGELGFNGNQGSFGNAPAADRDTWQTPKDLPSGTYTYFCRIHPFMRGAFRVEPQTGPRQTLRAEKKQRLAKAAVTETVDKSATVQLHAKVKGGKKAGASAAARALSQALDARRSTVSLNRGVETKIKLRFSKKARKRLRAALARSGSRKIVVTAAATDGFGKTTTAKTKFRLIG
jgi:plastocyanin